MNGKKSSIIDFENKILSSVKSAVQLSSKENHNRVEDIEELLLQIAKYPILASQLNGYLPLTIRKTSSHPPFHPRITLSFISLPFMYCFLQCIILPLMIFKFSSLMSSFVASMTNGVESDSVTLKVLAGLYLVNPFIHRVFGILDSKKTLSFWKTNCSLLENILLDEVNSVELAKMKSQSRFAFFGIFALSLFGSVAFTFLGPILMSLGLETESGGAMSTYIMARDISSQLLFLILPMFGFSHPLCVSLVNLFPKLYSASLQVIIDKVRSLLSVYPTTEPFIVKGTFGSLVNKKREDEVINQVIEMYENIFKLTKEYNSHFGSRLLGEIVYSMLSVLGFTYFVIVWLTEGQYSTSFCVTFPVIMSLGEMYALGAAGTLLSEKSNEVLDALQDLNPENMSPNIQWKVF